MSLTLRTMVFKWVALCLVAIAMICLPPIIRQYSFPLTVAGWVIGGVILLGLGIRNNRKRPSLWFLVTASFWAIALFYYIGLNQIVNAGSGQDAVQLFGMVVAFFALLLGLVTLGVGITATAISRSLRRESSLE